MKDVTTDLKNLNRWPIKTGKDCRRVLNARDRLWIFVETEKQIQQWERLGVKAYRRLAKIDDLTMRSFWESCITVKAQRSTDPADLARIGRGR